MRFTRYSEEIEFSMHQLYSSLSERDRRRYAAVEALKLGHGGILYLAHLFGCAEKTIRRGLVELLTPPELPLGRSRKKGLDANVVSTPSQAWRKTSKPSCAITRRATRCTRKSAGRT
jgi:hypothetical protein